LSLARIPQAKLFPVVMLVNSTPGLGSFATAVCVPQHRTVRSANRPQLNVVLALTPMKLPLGAPVYDEFPQHLTAGDAPVST
jgi:hypothetical protein